MRMSPWIYVWRIANRVTHRRPLNFSELLCAAAENGRTPWMSPVSLGSNLMKRSLFTDCILFPTDHASCYFRSLYKKYSQKVRQLRYHFSVLAYGRCYHTQVGGSAVLVQLAVTCVAYLGRLHFWWDVGCCCYLSTCVSEAFLRHLLQQLKVVYCTISFSQFFIWLGSYASFENSASHIFVSDP